MSMYEMRGYAMPDTESAACAAVSESDSCNEGEFRLMLGRKLKELRKRKLLTITQLSLYTGLSVGYLSNVERGQTSPTVDNLRKICDELDVSPAELITQKIEGKSIIRSTDAQIIVRPESGMTITQYVFGAIAEPYSVIRLEAGDFEADPEAMHPFPEVCHVLSGELTLRIEGEEFKLVPGDAMLIRANQRHVMLNCSDAPCESLWYQTMRYVVTSLA